VVLFQCHGLLLLRVVGLIAIVLDLAVELDFLVVDAWIFGAQGLQGGIDLVVERLVEQFGGVVFFYAFFRVLRVVIGGLECFALAVFLLH
jgi:hypothetical protein